MDRRFALFISLSLLALMINGLILQNFRPQPAGKPAVAVKQGEQPAQPDAVADERPAEKKEPAKEEADRTDDASSTKAAETAPFPPAEQRDQAPAQAEVNVAVPEAPPRRIALGSLDLQDKEAPAQMLVHFSNEGAGVERIELSSPRYRDIDDRSGYLGHLAPQDAPGGGCLTEVVGRGTPAFKAGLRPGDVIVALGGEKIVDSRSLINRLLKTKPGQTVEIVVRRNEGEQKLSAQLGRRPVEIIRPEWNGKILESAAGGEHDPLSFLLGLRQLDNQEVGEKETELRGHNLRLGTWEVVRETADEVSFRKALPTAGLEVFKHFRLGKADSGGKSEAASPGYHLDLEIEIRSVDDKPHRVAYRLDGPTGLPTEGAWYASKVGRNWGAVGLRDVIVRFAGGDPTQIGCLTIVDEKAPRWAAPPPLRYIAVDAQYFAAALIPHMPAGGANWFAEAEPIRVGNVDKDSARKNMTNVSFQLVSTTIEVSPEKPLKHGYTIFAGPKQPQTLAAYHPPRGEAGEFVPTLEDLNYYGWFFFVAQPMLALLHFFHAIVRNYGLAIVMLTVLVRGCMFPVSRKQALGAQKMQELQPEIKRINEKYKTNMEQRTKATQELFRKHEYNPMGGCLLMFIQLPIFVGLYRSLSVDVELRQAALLGDAIRWCSNLAAPDMLWDWSAIMPDFVNQGLGFFGLGPYLNVLPLVTTALFLWQQKMFMPPPADEQAAMQQKMMQYMMIFMGFMFFKVASGLCLYFIASSLWGIAERKLLPKTTAGAPAAATAPEKRPRAKSR